MKTLKFRLIGVLIVLINSLLAVSQDSFPTKVDSIYEHYRSHDIENYQTALPQLLEVYQYFKSVKDTCKIIERPSSI